MFGMSFAEIIVIALIAVVFLGPDKLPDAMVKFAKFFKMLKQTANAAKSTFETEIKMSELKDEASKFTNSINETAQNVRKKLTFEELDELKKSTNDALKDAAQSVNPLNSAPKGENV